MPAIIEATPEAALIRNDIYDRWPNRTWGRGRVVLLGDAIHPMTPDIAQGACQAIADATTLASCLAASSDATAALRAYQRRRWEGATACAVRDVLMRKTPLSVQLRQLDLVLHLQAGRDRAVPGSRVLVKGLP